MGGNCAAAGGRNLNLTAQRRPQQRETHTEGQIKDRNKAKLRITTDITNSSNGTNSGSTTNSSSSRLVDERCRQPAQCALHHAYHHTHTDRDSHKQRQHIPAAAVSWLIVIVALRQEHRPVHERPHWEGGEQQLPLPLHLSMVLNCTPHTHIQTDTLRYYSRYSNPVALTCSLLDMRLGCGHLGDGHSEGRAGQVVRAHAIEEGDRLRIPRVLASQSHLRASYTHTGR